MKAAFFLTIFLFHLLFVKSQLSRNEYCTSVDNLEIGTNKTNEIEYSLVNKISSHLYILCLNVQMIYNNYDLVNFTLVRYGSKNISFYLNEKDNNSFIYGTKEIELKLSDIIPGNYFIEIYKEVGKTKKVALNYTFSFYSNKKRLRDKDEYILYPNNTDKLVYEYGIFNNKTIIFKIFGNGVNGFDFSYMINGDNIKMDKKFFNGYLLSMDLNFFDKDKDIEFVANNFNENLTIVTYPYNTDERYLDGNNIHFDIIINTNSSECFDLNLNGSEKYIFKFTTYTKNILVSFIGSDEKNDIIDESSYYILDNKNISKVCFEKNERFEKDKAALSFDFLKFENNTINNYYKIIRGLPQRNILHSYMVGYYKPEYYNNISKNGVMNSFIIKGNPVFYISKNNENNEIIDNSINGYITYNYKINEKEPIYTKVECLSEECIFDINMKGIDEITYLKKDYEIFSFLEESHIDKYQINIKNANNDYLLINIHYPFQEPLVSSENIELANYKINLVENIISYNISIKEIEDKNLGNIFINIENKNQFGIYYGINYEITTKNGDDIHLEKGIAYSIDLNKNINSRNFIIRHNTDSKLIINANTFSNDIFLKINDKNYTSINNLINIELNKTEKEYFINIVNNSQISEQLINLCIYEEASSDSKIFIQEGIIYNNKLTKDNKKINYLVYLNKDIEYILNFRKYSNIDVNIGIKNIETKTVNKLSELICFTPEENICPNNICELEIVIKENNNENIEEETDFSFQIIKSDYKNEQTYIYLSKNTFISGILGKGKTIIYKGTYEKNDELFIDFLEGEGEANIKINNEGKYIEQEFDYYNKKFNIDENICKTTCEFTLTLSLSEKSNTQSKYKYNILLKTETTSYISIPPFETIYGLLKNDNKEHKYSIMILDNFYNYELDCKFCEIIEDEKNGTEIKFSIKFKEEMENINDYYNFRINFYNKNDTILYHLNSVRNHFYCEISKSKPCYYLTYISEYNNVENLQFLVQNNKNVEIYLKTFDKNSSEKIIYENIHDNNIDYDINTTNAEIKNYLDFKKEEDDFYILLKIVSFNENKMRINLVHNMFERDSDCIKNNYKDDYIIIDKNIGIDYTNTGEEYNILDVNLLKGEKMEIIYDDNHYYLKNGYKDNINIISYLKNEHQINLIFEPGVSYFRIIKNKNTNINEIRFGNSNYLTYIGQSEKENSNFNFYINLNNINFTNNDLHLNYKFLNIENSYFPDNENVEILCVDESFIIKEKEGLNNNVNNLLYSNLNEISHYQKDMGAGYNLININSILENLENNKSYLYIKFSKKPTQEFDFVITLTDFSESNGMPIDIYVFMFIKNKTHLILDLNHIPKGYHCFFFEKSHDSNLIFGYNDSSIDIQPFGKKTILILETGNAYDLTFENIESKIGKKPNLLIKFGASKDDCNKYFNLNNDNIIYHEDDEFSKKISFNPIESPEDLEYSVIYNILIYEQNISCNSIVEKTEPKVNKILLNDTKPSKEIFNLNISEILKGIYGPHCINILAEVKNEKEDNYEYILYNCTDISITINTINKNITISDIEGYEDFNYAKEAIIRANITKKQDITNNYKFIKLILIDKIYARKKFEIYASTQESFLEEKQEYLYKNSEYKSIDSYNNTVLAIPLNKFENSDFLYIRIHSKEVREFKLIYRIEDGRKMEGIKIHNNTCYDIFLQTLDESDIKKNYRFVYEIDTDYYPLITFTTYEINNDYKLFTTGLESDYLKKYFYNGYGFMIEYTGAYFEYHTFIVKPYVSTIFRICHKIIPKNPEKIYKPISIGENIYSVLNNEMKLIEDCYEIENEVEEGYEQYMFNYISKSQNMKLIFENNEKFNLFDESGNIIFNASTNNKFCISFRDEIKESYTGNYGSINFQILGVKNKKISEKITVPLINGYSMRHTLEPGQMIYYRLNKYKISSNFVKFHFQKLKGEPIIKKSRCNNYPNCHISTEVTIIDKYFCENNLYDNNLNEDEDVYNKDTFLVYIIFCNESSSENCIYYVGMHNEESSLSLNENRKYYFKLSANKELNFSTDLYRGEPISKKGLKSIDSIKYYLEIHLLEGKLDTSKVSINGESTLHNFNNKTYYYSTLPDTNFSRIDFYYFVNKLEFDVDTLFYITYRVLLDKNNDARKTDDFYNMFNIYEKEMHYNTLTPLREIFSYYYPEIDFKNNEKSKKYIVSISGINSYISVDDSDYKKYHQFELEENVTKINCNIENSVKREMRQCEFIFSYAELIDNYILKQVLYDGFYQYYEIDQKNVKNVYLYYNLTDDELSENYITITIKENSLNLTISYGLKANITSDNFLDLNTSLTTNKSNEIFRINLDELLNLYLSELDNNTEPYLLFRLSSEDTGEFKININIKNIPTYLYADEIIFSSIKPNEPFYYYFDYVSEGNDKAKDIEEIYLYNKGNVIMMVASIEEKRSFPYISHDMHEIVYNDSNYHNVDTNQISLSNENGNYTVFRIYIKVYLDEKKNIDNDNYYNSFSICRHTQKEKGLLIKLNNNIFGKFSGTLESQEEQEQYRFFIDDLTKLEDKLAINLVCKNCYMSFHDKKYETEYLKVNESTILDLNTLKIINDSIYLKINGARDYYFFSLSNPSLPKYIEESEPEICQGSCKFVFPLYNYSNYIKDESTKMIKIVLYSPDVKRIKINAEFHNISEGDDPLSNFTIKDDKNYVNNILIKEINVSDIMTKEKYLKVYVESKDKNQLFRIIMNKFITSKNIDSINPTNQIIVVHDKEEIFEVSDNDNNNKFFKISLKHISGEGKITINENGYDLNYDFRESISIISKLTKSEIKAEKSGNEDFIFYINVTKLEQNYEDIREIFEEQENYRIKYIGDDSNETDIFPLNLKIKNKIGYTTFVSYRFIELEKKNPENVENQDLINTTIPDFGVYLDRKYDRINKPFLKSVYYPDFQRGVAILNRAQSYGDNNYIDLVLNKLANDRNKYKALFLELALVSVSNNEEKKIEIDIPKDVYIQLDLNKINQTYELKFLEENIDYKYFQIEISNATYVNFSNNDNKCFSEKYQGKFTCDYAIDETTREQTIKLMPNASVTIFVKYTTKKDIHDFPNFTLSNNTIVMDNEKDLNRTKYNLLQFNIKPYNGIPENINYSLSYFIRLYDYLLFLHDNEIDNIIIPINGNMSFRMDCNDTRARSQNFTYSVNFTNDIERRTYFINVIGQVKYKDSVQYFPYKYLKFRLTEYQEKNFEQKWVIPLVFVLLLFCAIVGYIIYFNIKKYKEKKGKNQESKADILINDGDNVKDMKDVSEEEEDDNKDKEDDDDDEDDDHNENLIKV